MFQSPSSATHSVIRDKVGNHLTAPPRARTEPFELEHAGFINAVRDNTVIAVTGADGRVALGVALNLMSSGRDFRLMTRDDSLFYARYAASARPFLQGLDLGVDLNAVSWACALRGSN